MTLRELLDKDGLISQKMPGYEYRTQQIRAAVAIDKALSTNRHCMVEAGTGVGKSIAYLIPAINHALNGKRVVVSTHTLNLQSQLVNKDIPFLQGILPGRKFKAVLMKGRGNYLCLNSFDSELGQLYLWEDKNLKTLQRWALETETGDLSELDFSFSGWSDICSNADTCCRQNCRWFNKCFYYKMRNEAADADIVITNHSLFFSDLMVRKEDPNAGILPDYHAVIFDEAHHLEDVATKAFGVECGSFRIPNFLNKVRRTRGLPVTSQRLQTIEDTASRLFSMFSAEYKQEFFFTDMQNPDGIKTASEMADSICTLLDGLNREMASCDTDGKPELEDRISGLKRMCLHIMDDLGTVFSGPDEGHFRWGECSNEGKSQSCILRYSPLTISEVLQDLLWNPVDSVVLTSATISNAGTFDYVKSRLGLEDCREVIQDSPFDFANQCLLYVPRHLEFPSDSPAYADKVADEIEALVEASDGRAFLLFTSYRMMNEVYDRLAERLPYDVLKQGEMPNETLAAEFLRREKACLFGVSSFWEGVDIKGEALSCVVIDKLPFASPDSPVNKARVNAITGRGGDWFREYSMPQAQIRLKQGFGRLIRTAKDRGVVAILDSRLLKKSYGRSFLKSLPPCPITYKMDDVRDFFGREKEKQESA